MDYNHVTSIVTDIFERDFKDALKQLEPRGKSMLLRYYFSFYRKWLSSALISDTFLTPNNIIALTNQEYHKKALTTTIPAVKSFRGFKKFTFREISYSLDSHPVVDDLQHVVAYLAPSFTVSAADNRAFSMLGIPLEGYLDEKQEQELMQLVSLQDPFYVAYLFRIAAELGIIAKMPALYSAKMQVTPRFNELFGKKPSKQKSRAILEKIVAASIKLATDAVNTFFLTPNTIDSSFIRAAVTKPTVSDEIFDHIYNKLGIDFQSFTDVDTDKPLPDKYHEVMSSAFSLGAIISIHIVTVFGTYLQLISPMYSGSNTISRDMTFVQDALATNNDIEIPLFMLCTFFMPTELGLKFFGLPPENALPLPAVSSFSQLVDALENIDTVRLMMKRQPDEQDDTLTEGLLVCEFRVKLETMPSFWKRIACISDMTLDEFAACISYEFFGCFTADYSFHAANNINRFTEITPSVRKSTERSTETITIEEFLRNCEQEFLLIIRDTTLSPTMMERAANNCKPGDSIKLAVKYIGCRKALHKNFYPRITGEGKAFHNLQR